MKRFQFNSDYLVLIGAYIVLLGVLLLLALI